MCAQSNTIAPKLAIKWLDFRKTLYKLPKMVVNHIESALCKKPYSSQVTSWEIPMVLNAPTKFKIDNSRVK